jgi:tetratricopeptide (TPR) repeat protein/predicted Ser/Thr protein kinase
VSELDATLGDEFGSGDTLTATDAPGSRVAARPPERGTVIGRYVVLGKLGAGAMGIVLAAYDPELDRKVALKLLASHERDPGGARARLQREAQALARLDHPNVVGVHDVGVHGDRLFVTMEFVAGRTLGSWMKAAHQPRPWPEVVSKFVEAGRGLAAAHAAGLVHRDFKPENVMLGDDGRVRVLDFGLARAALADDARADRVDEPSNRVTRETLTRTGALVGTPAYMAPEQFDGLPADALADQFSFCVSLYEALHGERPFAAEGLAELLDAMECERIAPAPRGSNVPAWLRKLVVRGLAYDPAKRWPSMATLLDQLADDPATRRRKGWIAAGGLSLAGAVLAAALLANRDAGVCEGMDEPLVGVWDDDRRAVLEQAFLATDLGYAGETWNRVEPLLDQYAADWVAAREDACMATQRGAQSGAALDLRMVCLDERLAELRATVDELADADARVVERAIRAVTELPRLDRCADVEALTARVAPPEDPKVAERVRAVDAKLVEASAKLRAGKYDESLALTEPLVREAVELGYEPLEARGWLHQGKLHERLGDFEAAQAAFERAYVAATAQNMTREAASAANGVMYVAGYQLARHDVGRAWALHAEPLSRAVGTDEARAEYLDTLGALASSEGDHAAARASQEQALALHERQLGPDHPGLATYLADLGVVADLQGDYEQARRYHERALEIRIRTLGPEHPAVAGSLDNLGILAQWQGDYDEARRLHQRALTIGRASLGEEHPFVADVLNNLGGVEHASGNAAAARAYFEQSLAISTKVRGPDHPFVANAHDNLGALAFDAGEHQLAHEHHERSLAIRTRTQGPEHPDLAGTHGGLAAVALALGDFAISREHYERALAITEQSVGPEHPQVAYTLTGLGQALIAAGEAATAIPHLERALLLRSNPDVDPDLLAETRFELARALADAPVDQGRDRERATELARQARATWVESRTGWAVNVDGVDRWLAEHPVERE